MAKKLSECDGKAALKLFFKMQPAVIDETELRNVFGHLAAASLSEVATTFGVESSTVRNTWRRDGMPVIASQRGVGSSVSLVEVLIWLLTRNKKNVVARGGSDLTQQLNALELRRVDAVTRIQERKADVIEGGHAPVWAAQAWLRGVLNLVRDGVMAVPPKYRTRFPAKFANEWVGDMENDLRGVLTMIADKADSADEILERSKE